MLSRKFVIQEHAASTHHWDLRIEHDGVLVSWAVPMGMPMSFADNRLAIPTEDHQMAFMNFAGQIPEGEYGAGIITIWDNGLCEVEKWSEDEIVVSFDGDRIRGRYSLFQIRGGNWLIHKMR